MRYFKSSFALKRDIVAEVMYKIKERGGRFIRKEDSAWSIVPDEMSRLKIAHAMQSFRVLANKGNIIITY
jgi:hypothetical protein